jgi:3-methyladenine DNA glycosylase Mpg
LGIGRSLNGTDLCSAGSPLMIAANPEIQSYHQRHGPVLSTPRIGITLAADLPLRFVLAGSSFLSKAPRLNAS